MNIDNESLEILRSLGLVDENNQIADRETADKMIDCNVKPFFAEDYMNTFIDNNKIVKPMKIEDEEQNI